MLKQLISKQLREIANKIDAESCEMDEDQVFKLIHEISKVPMSKSDACSYLGISRTTFDYKVKQGLIPQGVKRRGFNELTWYRYDLDQYKEYMKSLENK